MKRLKAMLLALVLFGCFIGFALGANWIYSNMVTVPLQSYTLTLAETHNGLEVDFTGNLKLGSTPKSSTVIHIYATDNYAQILEELGNTTTDINGNFAYTYIAPQNGTFYFKAGCLP